MNDLQIEAFLAVLQYKSYSKAAQAIYVPQPTLSHRILQLEQELGASLLIRNAKEISLTEAGQHFLPYAHQLYRATENARQEMQSLRRGDGGFCLLAKPARSAAGPSAARSASGDRRELRRPAG